MATCHYWAFKLRCKSVTVVIALLPDAFCCLLRAPCKVGCPSRSQSVSQSDSLGGIQEVWWWYHAISKRLGFSL